MEKERKIKTLSLVALIVAVLGLTVAFAALSQTLTINGTATVNAAEWDVHMENLRLHTNTGATIISEPEISSDGTKIENFNISLSKPGDGIRYEFDLVNDGTVNAKLTSYSMSGVTFNITGPDKHGDYFTTVNGIDVDSSSFEENIIPLLAKSIFVKADWDGDGVTTDEEKIKAASMINFGVDTNNHILNAGQSYNESYIEVAYLLDAEELPKGEIVLNLSFSYVYSQS